MRGHYERLPMNRKEEKKYALDFFIQQDLLYKKNMRREK